MGSCVPVRRHGVRCCMTRLLIATCNDRLFYSTATLILASAVIGSQLGCNHFALITGALKFYSIAV